MKKHDAERDSILLKAAEMLKEWDKKVQELETKTKSASDTVKKAAEIEIENLKERQKELRSKLDGYAKRGEAAWDVIAKDVSALSVEAGKVLEKSMKKAFDILQGKK
ncbi:MAG: hypothetical protein JNM63_20045 [Spirochaetia bacterium]|nr:hypothetical protein [Spirochaetia bacterium]